MSCLVTKCHLSFFTDHFQFYPPSPTPQLIRACGRRSTGYVASLPSLPQKVGHRRWLEGGAPLPRTLVGNLLKPGRFHPGDVHFSQDHCHPPSYIPKPYNDLNGPEGLEFSKSKQEKKLAHWLTGRHQDQIGQSLLVASLNGLNVQK